MNNCISLTAREFWLNEELISSCCCLFVGFENGTWIKAFYNDKFLNWEIESLSEAPHLISEGDSEFYYPIKQYLNMPSNEFGGLIETINHNRNSIELAFSGGVSVLLSYNIKTESEKIELIKKRDFNTF